MQTETLEQLQLSDAIQLGSILVEEWGPCIDRCANGMAVLANGLKPVGCETIFLLYPWLAQIQPCPWCEERRRREPAFVNHAVLYGIHGFEIVRHPFVEHVLTKEIRLEDLTKWVRSIEPAREHYGIQPSKPPRQTEAVKEEELAAV
jgi:hypothetical protein